MKSNISRMILAFSFVATVATAIATAQVDSDAVFRITTPFSFIVRGKTFPAGEYVITTIQSPGDPSSMEISTVNGKPVRAVFNVEPISVNQAPKKSNVIFGKIEGKYYLSEIWEANNTRGNQVEVPDLNKLERAGIHMEKEVVQAEMSRRKTAVRAKH